MINFTVGPVQSCDEVREIGSQQVPYFRTPEFSKIMLENEQLIKQFSKANDDSRVVFFTGSGTASMEAAVINLLDRRDNVLIINGGTFGQRFVDLCKLHEVPYTQIKLSPGEKLTKDHLSPYENSNFSAFLVNVHETSTGVLYDMELISDFCHRNNLFLIVDAISSFLADEFKMAEWGIDVMITGSQKALACPPGISIIVLSKLAIQRLNEYKCNCMYLDIKLALKNGERGQTPFTPAVSTLLQINARLKSIRDIGGVEAETEKIAALAKDFREKIKGLPFQIVSQSLSNAVTPLHPLNADAYDIFTVLKDKYDIWVCPNGGELANKIFRVGHIGALTEEDNNSLILALKDMSKRGLI